MSDLPDHTDGQGDGGINCLTCGYALMGHPDRGVCPECGEEYAKDVIAASGALPTALGLVARFGWPVVLFAILAVYIPSTNNFDGMMTAFFCFGPLVVAALLINTCVQAVICVKRLNRQGYPLARPIAARIDIIQAVLTMCVIGSILIPAIFFGVCLAQAGI